MGAVVVDGCSTQISAVLASKSASSSAVEKCAVVPHDDIARLFPFKRVHVLGLSRMLVEHVTQLHRLLVRQSLDMMQMSADVEVRATTSFVDLYQAVTSHGELVRLYILEELGGAELAGLGECVATDVVIANELFLQSVGQLEEGSASIGELCVASCTLGRKLDGAEERETGSTEVVAGISVEKTVALVRLSQPFALKAVDWCVHTRLE
jgi:hypothetical protein